MKPALSRSFLQAAGRVYAGMFHKKLAAKMNVEMITREDLQNLKTEIVAELKSILSQDKPSEGTWLRSAQVRKMLSISPGTLQNLRIQGHLRFTKIGGCFFYSQRDIAAMLNQNCSKR